MPRKKIRKSPFRRVELPEIEAIYAKHGEANKPFFAEVRAAQGITDDCKPDDIEEETINAPLVTFIFTLGLPQHLEQFGKIADSLSLRMR